MTPPSLVDPSSIRIPNFNQAKEKATNTPTLTERPLRPARSPDEYRIHQAALEWSLADTIVIQSPDDIKSRVNWRDRLEPFQHQVQNLFTFCRRLPVTLLADDVGLGKTISAGLILSELMVRNKVKRALVLSPKSSVLNGKRNSKRSSESGEKRSQAESSRANSTPRHPWW